MVIFINLLGKGLTQEINRKEAPSDRLLAYITVYDGLHNDLQKLNSFDANLNSQKRKPDSFDANLSSLKRKRDSFDPNLNILKHIFFIFFRCKLEFSKECKVE